MSMCVFSVCVWGRGGGDLRSVFACMCVVYVCHSVCIPAYM